MFQWGYKNRCSNMVKNRSFPTLALFHIYGKRSSICLQTCGFDHHCTGQQSFMHKSSERRYMYTLVYWVLLPHVWDIRQWSVQVFWVCVSVLLMPKEMVTEQKVPQKKAFVNGRQWNKYPQKYTWWRWQMQWGCMIIVNTEITRPSWATGRDRDCSSIHPW